MTGPDAKKKKREPRKTVYSKEAVSEKKGKKRRTVNETYLCAVYGMVITYICLYVYNMCEKHTAPILWYMYDT